MFSWMEPEEKEVWGVGLCCVLVLIGFYLAVKYG